MSRPTVFHLPVCPYAQRIRIWLELLDCPGAVDFQAVDVSAPWPRGIDGCDLELPFMVLPSGEIISGSFEILDWVECEGGKHGPGEGSNASHEAKRRLTKLSEPFVNALYALLLNRVPSRRMSLLIALLDRYADLDDVLNTFSPLSLFVGRCFNFCDALYAPFFQRVWLLEYYENFQLPATSRYGRVARWQSACIGYPMAQQFRREQIIKLNYDCAMGAPHGELPPGRLRSSLSLLPDWSERPWPPRDKYSFAATDTVLGLVYGDIDADQIRR